ncbi:hypothetical protein ACN2XU_09020 [Primorskyibacter sp. 2E107]|uniref:hypothetical protein n=1 Tax=Primorskyibacter sp. 2E107 TaxID=3403458 RepID=UPI003AF7B149
MSGYFERLGARLTPDAVAPQESPATPVRLSLPEAELPDNAAAFPRAESGDPTPEKPQAAAQHDAPAGDLGDFDAAMEDRPPPHESDNPRPPGQQPDWPEFVAETLPDAPAVNGESDTRQERTADAPDTNAPDPIAPPPANMDPPDAAGEPAEADAPLPEERIDLETLLDGFFGMPQTNHPDSDPAPPPEAHDRLRIDPAPDRLMPETQDRPWQDAAGEPPEPEPEAQTRLSIGEIRIDVIEPQGRVQPPAPAPTPLRRCLGASRPARRRFGLDQS